MLNSFSGAPRLKGHIHTDGTLLRWRVLFLPDDTNRRGREPSHRGVSGNSYDMLLCKGEYFVY